jgi:hypothetical protein
MMGTIKILSTLAIGFLFVIGLILNLAPIIFHPDPYPRVDRMSFPIYSANVPYGMLYRESRGSAVYVVVAGAASYSSTVEERYIVKFFVGDELKTFNFNSNEVTVKADGKFALEIILDDYTTMYEYKFPEVVLGMSGPDDCWELDCVPRYIIHIPALPTPNQEATTTYQIFDK